MAGKKKAPAGAANTSKGNPKLEPDNSIEEVNKNGKAKKSKTHYSLESSMKTIAFKIYEEQLIDETAADFKARIEAIDNNKIEVIAIIHNKDYAADDFFAPAKDKSHIHIIARVADGTTRKVRTLLNMLGIKLRPEEDANMWQHALDAAKNFAKYAAYLTHETKEAAENDGKQKYELSELITNMDMQAIIALRMPYIYTGKQQPEKASIDVQANYIEIAKERGYIMQPLDEFLQEVPLIVLKQIERHLLRAYNAGQAKRVEEVRKSNFTRCAIFIKGEANQGKTYAAIHAFDDLNYKTICIDEATKTGKFDKLTALHEVMIVDDAVINNVLGLADDKPIECYRRNHDNPWFVGKYFIVTSNLNFDDWCRECGIDNRRQLDAARTRFFVCEVDEIDGQKYLRIDDYATRGQDEKLKIKDDMMLAFKERFENYIRQYNPKETKLDRSRLWENDPQPKQQEAQQVQIVSFRQLKKDECIPFG